MTLSIEISLAPFLRKKGGRAVQPWNCTYLAPCCAALCQRRLPVDTRNVKRYSFLCLSGPEGSCTPPDYPRDSTASKFHFTANRSGPAAGAGIKFRTKYVLISPEVRCGHITPGLEHGTQVTALVGFRLASADAVPIEPCGNTPVSTA